MKGEISSPQSESDGVKLERVRDTFSKNPKENEGLSKNEKIAQIIKEFPAGTPCECNISDSIFIVDKVDSINYADVVVTFRGTLYNNNWSSVSMYFRNDHLTKL